MELVVVELDVSSELNAIEYVEVAGAKVGGGTNLGSGRGRRMECGRNGRRSPSRDGSWRWWGWARAQAESIRAGWRRRAESSCERGRTVQSGRATQAGYANEWMRMGP